MKEYEKTENRLKYREQNKEKRAQYNKEYCEKNKEEISQQRKLFYEENKQKILIDKKTYYKDNKEKIALKKKEYYEKNKEKINEINEKKRKVKYTCDCGSTLRKVDKNRHEKSKKHQNFLLQNN